MQLNRSCREWFNTNATSVPVCQILFDVYKHFRDGEWQQGREDGLTNVAIFQQSQIIGMFEVANLNAL